MPILVLVLTQAKSSLLIATTTAGLATAFYKSQTSCWFTQLIFGTQGWELPPIQKRPRKCSKRLLSGGIHLPGTKTQEPSSRWGPHSTTHGQQ